MECVSEWEVCTISMKPVRIQMKRIRGFNLQKESRRINGLPVVLVTRPGKYGNPYVVGKLFDSRYPINREQAVAFYKERVLAYGFQTHFIDDVIRELKGKNLACFCKLCEKHQSGKPYDEE